MVDTYPVLPREIRNSKLAIVACACGLVGCLGVTAVFGILLGLIGVFRVAHSRGALRGKGYALTGVFAGLIWLVVLAVGGSALVWYLPQIRERKIRENEESALEALRRIKDAEEIFHMSDADHNGAHDYWTGDVATLNRFCRDRVDDSLALADACPVTQLQAAPGAPPVPCHGYLFTVLKTDEKGVPYQRDEDGDGKSNTNTSHYASCAYPAQYGESGRRTFLLCERGPICAKDLGQAGAGTPPSQWPKSPAADGWTTEPREKAKR